MDSRAPVDLAITGRVKNAFGGTIVSSKKIETGGFLRITSEIGNRISTNLVPFDSSVRVEHYGTYSTPLRFDSPVWGPGVIRNEHLLYITSI